MNGTCQRLESRPASAGSGLAGRGGSFGGRSARSLMERTPNQITGANSRPAFPIDAERQFGSAACAPAFLSAAVAQFWR